MTKKKFCSNCRKIHFPPRGNNCKAILDQTMKIQVKGTVKKSVKNAEEHSNINDTDEQLTASYADEGMQLQELKTGNAQGEAIEDKVEGAKVTRQKDQHNLTFKVSSDSCKLKSKPGINIYYQTVVGRIPQPQMGLPHDSYEEASL